MTNQSQGIHNCMTISNSGSDIVCDFKMGVNHPSNHIEIEVDVLDDTIDIRDDTIQNTIQMQSNDKTEIPLQEDKEFHLFLSHSSQDEEEVIKVLEILEAEPYNLQCCIDRRDFMLGETTMANINYALNKSMATVFFLTKDFIESDYCNHEKEAAYTMYLEGESRVIPVILKPCSIPDEFRSIHYIDEPFPEIIAEKVYKCLTIDPKDFKNKLPLQPIQAGMNRINGSRFEMIDTPLQKSGKLNLLTPHCKRELEKRAIKATEKFKILIHMIESFPALNECYRKPNRCIESGVAKYMLYTAIISSLLMANTTTIIYCGCEGFLGIKPHVWNCELMFASGEMALALALFLLTLLSLYAWRNMEIEHGTQKIQQINILSVLIHQCCFFLKVSMGGKIQLTAIKYDLNDCKAYLEHEYEKLNSDYTFDVIWVQIISSKTYKSYFEQLGEEILQHADEIRHQVLQDKLCFCQYFEMLGGFGKLKLKGKPKCYTNQRDQDRTELLANEVSDEVIIV